MVIVTARLTWVSACLRLSSSVANKPSRWSVSLALLVCVSGHACVFTTATIFNAPSCPLAQSLAYTRIQDEALLPRTLLAWSPASTPPT